jgi:hypothetical protein
VAEVRIRFVLPPPVLRFCAPEPQSRRTSTFVFAYIFVIRPWHMRWGATDQEVAMALPGDAIVPDAIESTRATTHLDQQPARLIFSIGCG